jgi:hypothetical protein
LNRPAGTNPQLQQANTPADTAATRWAFEPFGTGTFRLRNGNPDSGTECAYKDGATTNVRVTTCGTGGQFAWTFVGDPSGVFELQSGSSGLCLDLNSSAFPPPTTNLALKPCVFGGSAAQQMFLDRFNWP